MNIGMFLDQTFPPDPRVENEAMGLIQAGHRVFLYSIDFGCKKPREESIHGIHVFRNAVPSYIKKVSALAYTIPIYHILLLRSIKYFIRHFNIDALHIHDMQIARAVYWVNKHFALPVILDLHENRPQIMKYYAHVRSPLGRCLIFPAIWRRFEGKFIRMTDKVVVVTDNALKHYTKELSVQSDRFMVVPNTVRRAFFTDVKIDKRILERYKNVYSILYVGDTGWRRGLATVIQSLPHIIQEISNVKFVVVGRSKTDWKLKALVEQLDIRKYVEFVGWQDFSLFQSYILSSRICVCPIHRNTHHDTTYANKIFQYMALERPIIVSDSLAQKNLVEKLDCGLVFEDRNALDLARKILRIFRNPELGQLLAENGSRAVREHWHWEKTAQPMIDYYEHLEKSPRLKRKKGAD